MKALEELAHQGKINEKVYGKQKVYMIVQVSHGKVNSMSERDWQSTVMWNRMQLA